MKIALVGTRGVPAQYGGFETAVEEVGYRLASHGHDVRVYSRGHEQPKTKYRGMTVVNLPAVKQKSLETLSHTAACTYHLMKNPTDVAVVFNAANACFVPLLRARGIPTAVHVDGLEAERSKWGRIGRSYYRLSERLAVKVADDLIADAVGIANYYKRRYSADTTLLTYGMPTPPTRRPDRIASLGLDADSYHLVVARFEPENHVLEAVQAARCTNGQLKYPLVVVGSAPYANSYKSMIASASRQGNVRLVGRVDDQELLQDLYAGATAYIHGHSVGGTNPSLLRAMSTGVPVLAHDNDFNREVLSNAASYWRSSGELGQLLLDIERDGGPARARMEQRRAAVSARYDWDNVALGYYELCERLYKRRRR